MSEEISEESAGTRRSAIVVGSVVTVLALIGSRLIGLDLLYVIPLLLMLGGVTFLLHRWRGRRHAESTPAGIGSILA